MPNGRYAWLDTGTHAVLLDAGNFVRTLTERQGQQVGLRDEVGWIDAAQLQSRPTIWQNDYGSYLEGIAQRRR